MIKKWTIEEIEILRRNYPIQRSNIPELIKRGRSKRAIINKAFKSKLCTDNKWKLKEISFLRENYKKMDVGKIAKRLKRNKKAIWQKAHEMNLIRRYKFTLPSSAYNPSENLAWIIGYLLGDGFLTTGWTIGMKTKDKDLKKFYMEKFKEWSRCGEEKFIFSWERKKYKDERKSKIYNCKKIWVIRVCSKIAWQFLKKFKDNPLYSLKFFSQKYWKFILKGLWDAEGNITPHKGNNRIVIGFSNSNEKILKLYDKICLSLGFHPVVTCRDGGKIINICSLAEVLDFVDKIGITIARKRKKVIGRINELRKKREIYHKVIKLRKKGLKRKQILERFNGFIFSGTFDSWVYSGKKPYYIENAKTK